MRQVTKTVYQFDELSDKAKEKARDWFKGILDSDDFDTTIDEAERFGEMMGIDFAQHRVSLMSGVDVDAPNIWWSLSYSQGDGACFEGSYAYAKGGAAAVRAEFGDGEVSDIADGLQALQKAHGYKLRAKITQTDRHYTHEYTVSVDVWKGDNEDPVSEEVEKELTEYLRRYMRWIYKQLVAEDEYRRSDESVDDNIRANEYEFEADGSRTRD
jgi:hypothetical protein